jgi:hypothetical protein
VGVLLDSTPMVMVLVIIKLHMTKELARSPKTGGYKRQADLTPSIMRTKKRLSGSFQLIQNAQPLFCRQMCVDTFLEQFNETIDRLPNLIEV